MSEGGWIRIEIDRKVILSAVESVIGKLPDDACFSAWMCDVGGKVSVEVRSVSFQIDNPFPVVRNSQDLEAEYQKTRRHIGLQKYMCQCGYGFLFHPKPVRRPLWRRILGLS